jgi:hypothetical protein
MSAKPITVGRAYLVRHGKHEQVVLASNGAHAIEIYLGML